VKAAVHHQYGPPEVVEVREVDTPVPTDDDVLVRVRAAALNALDWYGVSGRPYIARMSMGLRRPKDPRIGVDFAGVVEAVGANVTRVAPGDEVFGGRAGALAEYVTVPQERAFTHKPAGANFEEAAAIPVAAITALQGLRDKGGIEPGQKVLINGATGGVGSFAVQIAKALGAEVTGVCSTGKVELVRSLGADHVVDYEHEDFTRLDERFDVFLDIAGNRPWSACKRVLKPDATLVLIGGPRSSRLLGPLRHVARIRLAALRSGRKVVFFLAQLNTDDLELLRGLVEAGTVRPVVERSYELSEVAEAIRYVGDGHCRGKVVVTT
jgi:NADPH:quinone reductase-like Zn-dependent oxidoreductase